MKAKSPRWFDRSYGRLLTPFETNPFHDRIAALLVAMGWILMAVAFWLGGNSGLGFDRQPDLGGYGWLIVGLLLLVAALSALWANRRVIEQGGQPIFLWVRVRRLPDDGQASVLWDGPDDMPIFVLAFGSSFLGFAMANVENSGHHFDTSPIPWVIVGILLAGSVVCGIWVHRRVLARSPNTHGVGYIRDGYAKAAAETARGLAVIAAWTAGSTGVPTNADGNLLFVAFIAVILGAVCFAVPVARTSQFACGEAASSMAEQTQSPP